MVRADFLYTNTTTPMVTATSTATTKMIIAGLDNSSFGLGGGVLTVTVVVVEFTAAPVASVTCSMKVQLPVAVAVEVAKL